MTNFQLNTLQTKATEALGSTLLTDENDVNRPMRTHVSHTYLWLTRQRWYLIARDCEKPYITECCKTQAYHLRLRTLVTSVSLLLSELPSLFEGIHTCLFALLSFLNGVLFLKILSCLTKRTNWRNRDVCFSVYLKFCYVLLLK